MYRSFFNQIKYYLSSDLSFMLTPAWRYPFCGDNIWKAEFWKITTTNYKEHI